MIYRLHGIAISIADSSSVRYHGGHISYDIVHECTSHACAAHILQQWRLRLIDVTRRAHRPWLPLPHIPGVDLSYSAFGTWGGDWGTAVAPVVTEWWAKLRAERSTVLIVPVVSKS